ncbi:MAG: PIN domain-containing protein [Candidatus Nanohaloarchaea archaeon]
MIVDTSFIIDLMDDKEEAIKKLTEIEKRDVTISVTPVTAFELRYGALQYHDTESEKTKINQTLDELSTRRLPLGWSQGNQAAEIMHKLEKQGDKIEFEDVTIASLAKDTDQKILTGNPEHFQKINGVEVESY